MASASIVIRAICELSTLYLLRIERTTLPSAQHQAARIATVARAIRVLRLVFTQAALFMLLPNLLGRPDTEIHRLVVTQLRAGRVDLKSR